MGAEVEAGTSSAIGLEQVGVEIGAYALPKKLMKGLAWNSAGSTSTAALLQRSEKPLPDMIFWSSLREFFLMVSIIC